MNGNVILLRKVLDALSFLFPISSSLLTVINRCVRPPLERRICRSRCRWRNWLPTCKSSSRTPPEFVTTGVGNSLLLNESWTSAAAATTTYTRLYLDALTSWDEVSWRFRARFFYYACFARTKCSFFHFLKKIKEAYSEGWKGVWR